MKLTAKIHMDDGVGILNTCRLSISIDPEGNRYRESFTLYTKTPCKALMRIWDKHPTIEIKAVGTDMVTELCRGVILEVGPSGYCDETIIKGVTTSEFERMHRV